MEVEIPTEKAKNKLKIINSYKNLSEKYPDLTNLETFFSIFSAKLILLSFFVGFRFDLSSLVYTNLVFIVLSLLPFSFRRFKGYQTFLFLVFIVFNSIMLALEVPDIEYYKFAQRRSGVGEFNLAGDFIRLIPSFVKSYWYLWLLFPVLVIVVNKVYKLKFWQVGVLNTRWYVQSSIFLIGIGLSIIGARGGIQLRPITPVGAGVALKDARLIPLATNTTLNFIFSFQQKALSEEQYFSDKESIDPNLRSLEFLPRDPSSNERLPNSDELIKVELPEPEEIVLKPQLDQNEVVKESVSDDIANTLSKYIPANEELGLSESDKGLVKIDLPDPVLLKSESSELPHREVSGEIEVSSKDGTGIVGEAANKESAKDTSGMGPIPYSPGVYDIPEELKIELPDPDDFVRTKSGHLIDPFAPEETPEINMIEGDGPLPSDEEETQISEIPELPPPPPEPERTIHGILELKPPEIDDAPFLTLTYDFSKIPHPFKLSKNYSIMEYSYYKYKPMLMKAQEFARRKMLKNALNYYRVIKSQNIPPELKNMINRNITDITEFLEKFIMSKGG